MAKLLKRLCLPVGAYQKEGADKPQIEYRDIGVVLEFEAKDGTKWKEVRLHADILNPVLFQLAKGQMDKGSSACRVKMFDVERKAKEKAADGTESQEPSGADDIPF